jgi:hypothetical protein
MVIEFLFPSRDEQLIRPAFRSISGHVREETISPIPFHEQPMKE